MRIVHEAKGIAAGDCVIATPDQGALVSAAVSAFAIDSDEVRFAAEHRSSRPLSIVHRERASMVFSVAAADGVLEQVRLHQTPTGILVVAGADDIRAEIAEVVEQADGDAAGVLARILLALSRLAEEGMESMNEALVDRPTPSRARGRADDRGELSTVRARALTLDHVYASQARLLAADGELAEAQPDEAARLGRAGAVFQYAGESASRAADAVGDTLADRDAMVMERLTLVSTIFLPLTLATSFFGMNFRWMTDHIDSGAAFAGLGLVGSVLFSVVTVVAMRRFTDG